MGEKQETIDELKEMENQLKEYRKHRAGLSSEEQKLMKLYQRKLVTGEYQGPLTDFDSLNMKWLANVSEEAIMQDVPKKTIYGYLKECSKNRLSKLAINFFSLKIEYKKMFKKIDEVAASLTELGVKKGDVVVLNTVTLPQSIFLLYALNKIGAVTNPTDLRTGKGDMTHYLNEGHSKFLFTLDVTLPMMNDIKKDSSIEKIVVLSPFDIVPSVGKKISQYKENKDLSEEEFKLKKESEEKIKSLISNDNNIYSWENFMSLKKKTTKVIEADYEPNQAALIIHTSGSTKTPKSVVLTNENLNAMVLQYKYSPAHFKEGDKFLNIIPIFVAYGVVNALHMPLCLGLTNIVYPKIVGRDFLDILMKFKPNHVLAIPMHWRFIKEEVDKLKQEIEKLNRELVDSINNGNIDKIKQIKMQLKDSKKKLSVIKLRFLLTAGCGGDKITVAEQKDLDDVLEFCECPSKTIVGYGSTEGSSAEASNFNESIKKGSIGQILYMNDAKVIDLDTGLEVHSGEKGELCVSGPTVMKEYLNNPSETAEALQTDEYGKTWLHSGDVVHFEDDGFVDYDYRKKRVIVNRGFKVSATAIEEVVAKHPAIQTCVVVPVKHSEDGEIPVVDVVLKPEYLDKEEDVLSEIDFLCKKELTEFYIPYAYYVTEDLPYTKNSKIDYDKLKEKMTEKYYSEANLGAKAM